MRHKGEIFFPASLHYQRLLRGKCLHGQPDCLIDYPVDNVERLPLQVQTVAVGEIVDTAAQDVVFRNDFRDIKAVFDSLRAMLSWASIAERLRDRFVGPRLESRRQLLQESGDMVVERRGVEIFR